MGLRFLPGEDAAYLRLGDEISAWTGATGQVQALYLAGLEIGRDMSAGFVFFHRAASFSSALCASEKFRPRMSERASSNAFSVASRAAFAAAAASRRPRARIPPFR